MKTALNRILLLLAGSLFIFSCGNKELETTNADLQAQLDSLTTELNVALEAESTLEDIGTLLDTIESQRDIIRMEMVEGGIEREDYINRIENLNQLLEEANNKVGNLENARGGYVALIAKLRKELDARNREIEAFEDVLDVYQAENISMQSTILLQENEIDDLELEIALKTSELMLLENRISEMIVQTQMTEADAYYSRAVAYEEAANRTKLAPRKKKETLQQALDLYKQALALGKDEAEPKVRELEEKLN